MKPTKAQLNCIGHTWKKGREHRAVFFGYADPNGRSPAISSGIEKTNK
jgi:hypothetical protein